MTISREEAERIVADVRELVGRPAGLSEQQLVQYYRIMTAIAMDLAPRDASEKLLLSDWTEEEFNKLSLRNLKNVIVQDAVDQYWQQDGRRVRWDAEKQKRKLAERADAEAFKDSPPAVQRQAVLEDRIDGCDQDMDTALTKGETEAAYARALKNNMGAVAAADDLYGAKLSRRNGIIHLIYSLRDIRATQQWTAPAKQIDLPVVQESEVPSISPPAPSAAPSHEQ
jgi:hypothetical protein